MRTSKIIFVTMIFILCACAGASYAESGQPGPKVRIAVYKIRTHNCEPALGMALEELMMSRLFSTSIFSLMEKSQMERIAEKSGIQDFDVVDNAKMAQLGQKLKVDKIIVGSLIKLGTYRLEIRSIDVYTGMVDVSSSTDVESEKDLEKNVIEATGTFERYYQGYTRISGKFDLGASVSFMYPFGKFGDYFRNATGVMLIANANNAFKENWTLKFTAGAYSSQGKKESVKSLSMFPFGVTYGPVIRISKSLTLNPSGGLGFVYSRANYDPEDREYGEAYQYRRKTLMNLSMIGRCEGAFFIYDRYCAVIMPELVIMPEKGATSCYMDMCLGVKVLF